MTASATRGIAAAVLESSPPVPRVGRPPRVTHQAIIAAALEIGLEGVTLKQIADRLDVAQATLYRHVRNRDELMRLAAFQLMLSRRLPNIEHAHWSELVTRYAESLFDTFLEEPQLISELLRGRLGPHAEIDLLEHFLDAIGVHGFSPEDGVALFHAIGSLTIGAAAGAIGLRASIRSGAPWHTQLRDTLNARDPDELPQVRGVLPKLMERNPLDWKPALRALIAGFAARRGETLPE